MTRNHVREAPVDRPAPTTGSRHSWPPWPERAQGESLRIAGLSETVRGQKTPQKQRRRRKPVCAVERRRACARVSFADGTRSHAALAEVSQTLAAADHVLTEASSGALLVGYDREGAKLQVSMIVAARLGKEPPPSL